MYLTSFHSTSYNLIGDNRRCCFVQMSDVEAGGSTVFTELNVALSPRKGSAAFWHNLLPSGQVDERTRHASCPVLSGSKWSNY